MGRNFYDLAEQPEAPIPLSVETIKHLRAVIAVGCEDRWKDRCFYCRGEILLDKSAHEPGCPYAEAKAFLDGIDKPSS